MNFLFIFLVKENHDDRYLQENIETKDCLTIESDEEEMDNVTSDTIGKICVSQVQKVA